MDVVKAFGDRASGLPTIDEIKIYMSMPSVPQDQDPLLWWRMYGARFPVLSRLARKFLSAPATSAPSERVWSAGGEIICERRSRLTDASAEALIFCHENITYCQQVAEQLCEHPFGSNGVFASRAGSGLLLRSVESIPGSDDQSAASSSTPGGPTTTSKPTYEPISDVSPMELTEGDAGVM